MMIHTTPRKRGRYLLRRQSVVVYGIYCRGGYYPETKKQDEKGKSTTNIYNKKEEKQKGVYLMKQ